MPPGPSTVPGFPTAPSPPTTTPPRPAPPGALGHPPRLHAAPSRSDCGQVAVRLSDLPFKATLLPWLGFSHASLNMECVSLVTTQSTLTPGLSVVREGNAPISTPGPAGLRRRGRADPRSLAHPLAEFQRQRWGTGRQPGTTRYKLACLVLANRRQRSARRADAAAPLASRPGAAATLPAPSAALCAVGRGQDGSKPLCQEADPPRRATPFPATAPR